MRKLFITVFVLFGMSLFAQTSYVKFPNKSFIVANEVIDKAHVTPALYDSATVKFQKTAGGKYELYLCDETGKVVFKVDSADNTTAHKLTLGVNGVISGGLYFVASDNDLGNVVINTSDQLVLSGFGGGVDIDGNFTAGTVASDGAVSGTTITASTGFALGDGDYIGVTGNEVINFYTAGYVVVSGALFGIATTAPDKAVEINSATGINLRLTYNDANGSAANYADFSTTATGNATINTSGGYLTITDNLIITGGEGLTVDGTYWGTTVIVTAGATIAFGQTVVLKSDGEYYLTDADAVATMPAMGIAVSAGTDGNPMTILILGYICETDWNWTPADGQAGLLYADDGTAGGMVEFASIPSDAGDQVVCCGRIITADCIYFNPSYTMVEI